MELIKTIKEMKAQVSLWKRDGLRIGCVPTMGALHEGHLRLIDVVREHADRVVLTIFVNPSQFGPKEDFEKYPRPLEKDLELAKSRGADVVFHPSVEEIYPEHFQTLIEVTELSKPLCGLYRLGHFRGVATVVLKLFNIVQPDVALFGEKDYQQLQIIRRMAKDLHLDVEIIGVPTVRVSGGLAMSSRNQYLSSEELKSAIALSKALNKAQELVDEGMIDAIQIIEILREMIEQERECKVQYISICHPETLERMTRVREKALIAMSVFCGETRLIDNRIIKPNEKTI